MSGSDAARAPSRPRTESAEGRKEIAARAPSHSGEETTAPHDRERGALRAEAARPYGTIVVIGGGCYGSFYVRQLERAQTAGALRWEQVIVVDRDPACAVARTLAAGEIATPGVRLEVSEWTEFFRRYLASACADPVATARDAIVPSPLMPHLMYEWMADRARAVWPDRPVAMSPPPDVPGMPWQRPGADGTRYVSFAEWVCPINCIEPDVCPKTRDTRWWTMPMAVEAFVAGERAAGRSLAGPVIFHCTHRSYGVGMFDTAAAVAADRVMRDAAARGAADILVGTVSHCHGALSVLSIGTANGQSD